MRTVTFKSVLDAVGRRAGVDVTTWDANTQANVAEFVTAWTRKGWEWEFWPEWTPIEQRAYRDAYDSTKAYPAPTASTPQEVWYPDAQGYFQALRATTGHPPAVTVNGQWVANGPYWALSATGYTYAAPYQQLVPPDYSANDWLPNTLYAASTPGNAVPVRNPGDNRFYQCITTHTSGTTFDPTKWGILTTFERYVSLDQAGKTPIGEVRRVSRSNPRTSPRYPGEVTFTVDDHGIMPAPMAGALVWVEFRLRPPVFTSEVYSAAGTYALGYPVYQPTTTGECYVSLVDGNNGNTPETSPDKWVKQPMPYLIAEFVKWAACADLLRTGGDSVKAAGYEEKAFIQLSQASDVALASQGQYERATATVY